MEEEEVVHLREVEVVKEEVQMLDFSGRTATVHTGSPPGMWCEANNTISPAQLQRFHRSGPVVEFEVVEEVSKVEGIQVAGISDCK